MRKFRQLGDIIELWEIISIRGEWKKKARLRDKESVVPPKALIVESSIYAERKF